MPQANVAISQIALNRAQTPAVTPLIQPPGRGLIRAMSVQSSGIQVSSGGRSSFTAQIFDGGQGGTVFAGNPASFGAQNGGKILATGSVDTLIATTAAYANGAGAAWYPPFMLIGPFNNLDLPFDNGLFMLLTLKAGNFPGDGFLEVNVYYTPR